MTATEITTETLQALWSGRIDEIDRGDTHPSVTRDDLVALMSGDGIDDNDWTDDGTPADHMWPVLVEQLSGDTTDNDPQGTDLLQDVQDAHNRLEQAREEVLRRTEELHDAIRAAMHAGAPRQAISDASGVSIPRLYQIRDGRR